MNFNVFAQILGWFIFNEHSQMGPLQALPSDPESTDRKEKTTQMQSTGAIGNISKYMMIV